MYVVFFSPEELVLHHAVAPHISVSDTYCAVVLHDNVWPVLHSGITPVAKWCHHLPSHNVTPHHCHDI